VQDNNTTVVNNSVSYNGKGGATAQPTGAEQAAAREQHVQPTANQVSHEAAARADRNQLASVNHGKPATAAVGTINGRRDNQQGRIANGIRNGTMSPGETAKAEKTQQNINRQVAADRKANGGKLTPQEKKNINKEQNAASRQIYNEKHHEK
jgi:hypothetical protein